MAGRPRDRDPQETRARILRAASALFAAAGERGVSTREVARDAGVSLATLHHHFGGKDELYAASVAAMYHAFAGLRDELAAARGDTPGAWVADVLARGYRFARAHRAAIRLTTRDAVERGRISRARRDEVLVPALEQGAAALRAWLAASGASPPELPELRLVLRSLSYLVVRYVLTDAEELAAVVGHPEPRRPDSQAPDSPGEDALHARVEAHLTRLALRALGLPEPTP
ncbi:MAG: TetR/AcrR family transcriptional regulator [Planctomycetota bacterium]